MSTRVSLMTSGSRDKARSIAILSDGFDLEPAAGHGESRHQPHPGPQRQPGQEVHRRAAPHRRRGQDDAVDIGNRCAALAGHRHDRHRTAHAVAEQIERHSRVEAAQDLRRRRGVGGERRPTRPKPSLGRGAKAALVVGVGGDAVLGPGLARPLEGVAVVVEAVQREDHRLDLPPLPAPAAICAAAAPVRRR